MTERCRALVASCRPVLRFLASALAVIAIMATTQDSAQDCLQWRTAVASMRPAVVTVAIGEQIPVRDE